MEKGKKVTVGLLVVSLLWVLALPAGAFTAEDGAKTAFAYDRLYYLPGEGVDTISVFGFGSGRGAPAGVQVSFGVTTSAPSAPQAQAEHRRLLAQIAANLEREGVSQEQISTLYFNIWPEYLYGEAGEGQPEVVGYRVNSTISVHLTDTSLVAAVIDAAFAAGVDRLEGIRYIPAPELKQKALLAALQDARTQAEGVAAALGRRVGRVLAVDQSVAPPYELWEERYPTAGTGLEPYEIEVSQYVRLVFSLE